MPSNWQTSSSPVSDLDQSPVAIYSAVVGTTVETSSFEFMNDIAPAVLRRALEAPPRWAEDSWPSEAAAQSAGSTQLALLKAKAILDVGARLEARSAAELRGELIGRFPALAHMSPGTAARYELKVFVQRDGQASWGVRTLTEGRRIPGVGGTFSDEKSDIQMLVQNLCRADIIERIEELST